MTSGSIAIDWGWWASSESNVYITAYVVFALATKAIIFGLAATGLATLWMAIAADVGTSLAVILNGMRMRNVQ